MPRIRILLADDSETFRHGLRKLLESDARLEVVCETGNGLEVVTLAARRHPDVILMDIRMPGQDGLAAARKIHELLPMVKIIVLTSFDTPVMRKEALEAGVKKYLLKDIEGEKLLSNVCDASPIPMTSINEQPSLS